MLVPQRAGVIAEQPGVARAAGYADLLLDALLRRHCCIAFFLILTLVFHLGKCFLLEKHLAK